MNIGYTSLFKALISDFYPFGSRVQRSKKKEIIKKEKNHFKELSMLVSFSIFGSVPDKKYLNVALNIIYIWHRKM